MDLYCLNLFQSTWWPGSWKCGNCTLHVFCTRNWQRQLHFWKKRAQSKVQATGQTIKSCISGSLFMVGHSNVSYPTWCHTSFCHISIRKCKFGELFPQIHVMWRCVTERRSNVMLWPLNWIKITPPLKLLVCSITGKWSRLYVFTIWISTDTATINMTSQSTAPCVSTYIRHQNKYKLLKHAVYSTFLWCCCHSA